MMGIDETKVDAMTRDELYEKLKPLAMALQNNLISKQHAFNTNRNLVDECKSNGINNKLMVEDLAIVEVFSDLNIAYKYYCELHKQDKSRKLNIGDTRKENLEFKIERIGLMR